MEAMMIASIASTALGTVLQVRGQQQQAAAAAASSRYQAQVAENNRITAERQAADTIERGQTEEQRSRQQTRQLQGRQVAALAASGVDTQSGSALDIIGDTAALGEIDALTIRDNAAREAHGQLVQAQNFGAQGQLLRQEASNQDSFSPVGTLLTGVGGIADRWWSYRRQSRGSGNPG